MESVPYNCNTSALDPYVPGSDNPWGEARIKHCYRRLGYGADLNKINAALNLTPGDLIDQIVEGAFNAPLRDPPWAYFRLSDFVDPQAKFPNNTDFRIETGIFNVA